MINFDMPSFLGGALTMLYIGLAIYYIKIIFINK